MSLRHCQSCAGHSACCVCLESVTEAAETKMIPSGVPLTLDKGTERCLRQILAFVQFLATAGSFYCCSSLRSYIWVYVQKNCDTQGAACVWDLAEAKGSSWAVCPRLVFHSVLSWVGYWLLPKVGFQSWSTVAFVLAPWGHACVHPHRAAVRHHSPTRALLGSTAIILTFLLCFFPTLLSSLASVLFVS